MRSQRGVWHKTMSDEQMASRVEAAILAANEEREKELEGKEFTPFGYSEKHIELIKKIDAATQGDDSEARTKELVKEAGKKHTYQTVDDQGNFIEETL